MLDACIMFSLLSVVAEWCGGVVASSRANGATRHLRRAAGLPAVAIAIDVGDVPSLADYRTVSLVIEYPTGVTESYLDHYIGTGWAVVYTSNVVARCPHRRTPSLDLCLSRTGARVTAVASAICRCHVRAGGGVTARDRGVDRIATDLAARNGRECNQYHVESPPCPSPSHLEASEPSPSTPRGPARQDKRLLPRARSPCGPRRPPHATHQALPRTRQVGRGSHCYPQGRTSLGGASRRQPGERRQWRATPYHRPTCAW
jgi:hypothetical protein